MAHDDRAEYGKKAQAVALIRSSKMSSLITARAAILNPGGYQGAQNRMSILHTHMIFKAVVQ